VVVVAAAGNDGAAAVSFPAADAGVIAVSAVRYDRTRPSYANHGSALDLVAPGGDLSVDQDGDGRRDGIFQQTFVPGQTGFCICGFQGTSMAAPQVSAVAALVAARGVSDPAVIEGVLRSTALDLGATGWDSGYGSGLVQAGAAVRAPLPGSSPPAPVPVAPTPTPTLAPVSSQPAPAEGPAPDLVPAPEPAPLSPDLVPGAVRGIQHACPADQTPAAPFVDLASTVHGPGIACVAWWGVANGLTPALFAPGASMTRGQLASFVARMLEAAGLEPVPSPPDAFTDDDGSVHEARIDQLAALRVVQGRGAGTFAPDATVTRAEMATFLVRAHDALASQPLPAGEDRFTDDDESVHAGSIDKIAAAGLAGGISPGLYAPTVAVQRGQMATFLARTLDRFVALGDSAPR
jgi:hypothetical protein